MISIDLRGAERFLETSRKFRGSLTRTISRSLGRGLRKTAAKTRRDLRGLGMVRGITRSTWGRRKENRLTARVKPIRLRIGGEGVEAALGLYGFAAALEGGGRLVPHTIHVGGRAIRHPGARVERHGFGGSNLRRDDRAILQQLDQDVGELVGRLYGL